MGKHEGLVLQSGFFSSTPPSNYFNIDTISTPKQRQVPQVKDSVSQDCPHTPHFNATHKRRLCPCASDEPATGQRFPPPAP